MADKNHLDTYGAELRKQADSSSRKWLFYGTVLLFAHLLDIKPTQIELMSSKITISSPYIVYGALGLLFLFFFYDSIISSYYNGMLTPFQMDKHMMRFHIRKAKNKLSDPGKIKKQAKSNIRTYNILIIPPVTYYLIVIIFATVASLYDIFQLCNYIFSHSHLIGETLNSASEAVK